MLKQKSEEPRIIYYEDELNDEFSEGEFVARKIDGTYDYLGGVRRKIGRVIFYQLLAKSIGWCFLKLKYRHKIVNKECLSQVKDTGFFLYGNHTNAIADALIPTMICRPTGVHVIVHPNNVSIPVLRKITPCLGAIPLPDDKVAMKNFQEAIDVQIGKQQCVAIYPEAHIWPYYTGIRNFKDSSFRYPAKSGVPTFCFTNTYQKRKWSKTPQIVTYVDGPFYADEDKPIKEQRQQLHAQVMASMKRYCQNSNVELIKYVKKES